MLLLVLLHRGGSSCLRQKQNYREGLWRKENKGRWCVRTCSGPLPFWLKGECGVGRGAAGAGACKGIGWRGREGVSEMRKSGANGDLADMRRKAVFRGEGKSGRPNLRKLLLMESK